MTNLICDCHLCVADRKRQAADYRLTHAQQPPAVKPLEVKTPEQILEHCKEVMLSKRQDYTSSSNQYENFERSAMVTAWFTDEIG